MGFREISLLVRKEQERKNGNFIDSRDLNSYLSKIERKAEVLAHYTKHNCSGFVAFYCNDINQEQAYITLILVAPEFRGKGIASSLIDGVISVARERGFLSCALEVEKGNSHAIRLYEKKGFYIARSANKKFSMVKYLN